MRNENTSLSRPGSPDNSLGELVLAEMQKQTRLLAETMNRIPALHNDWTLILDELGQIDPKEAGEAAYLLDRSAHASARHRTLR